MAKVKYKKVLLVEGNDDFHVISTLCQKYDIFQNFEIIDTKGYSELEKQIPARLIQSDDELDTLGIIVDADLDIKARYEKINSIFRTAGYTLNINIPNKGYINVDNRKKIGVWIMPDNTLNGMLEDFIKYLIEDTDSLIPYSNKILDDIEANGLKRYKHRQKAFIHTWLAWQEEPGTPMGQAITRKYLTKESATLFEFLAWLVELFKKD